MKNLEMIKEDLKGLVVFESDESIEERVIEIFEDYEFEGETEVIVEDTHTCTNIENYGLCSEWVAYINHKDAPVIGFAINRSKNDEEETIVEVVEVEVF